MKTQSLSRREFLRLTGTALGAGLLVGCVPQTVQAPAAANPEVKEEEAGEAAPAQEQIVIRYGRHDPGLGANTTIEKFMAEHPNIKIEMEQIGEFPTKIPALAAAGTLPDVVRSWEAMVFEMARGGQFIDLQPFIDTEPDFNPEDFYEAVYNYPVLEGKRYGINDVVATHVTYYNADLFDQKGVEYPDPANFTWQDFEEKARAISDPDNQIWGSETIPVGWHYFTLKQLWQNNADFFTPDYKSCIIDQPEAIEATQFWADLLLDGNVMPSPSQIIGIGGAGAAAELMGAGKIGMQRMGSWITTDLVNNNIRFNIVPEPTNKRLATIAHGGLNAITSTSPHPDEAWMWINANCSTEGIYNYAAGCRFPGARRSTNEIEPHTWVADVDFEVNWDVVLESVEYAYMLPGPCNEGEVLKVIGDSLEKIYSGEVKAADIFPEIKPRVNELLEDC
jgi:multiple sugar transport system substrate-binding protein